MKTLDELLTEFKCQPGLVNGQTMLEAVCDNGTHQGVQTGICEKWDSRRLLLKKDERWSISIALEDIAHIRTVEDR